MKKRFGGSARSHRRFQTMALRDLNVCHVDDDFDEDAYTYEFLSENVSSLPERQTLR